MMFEKSRDTIETERLILRPWEATQEFAEGLYSYAKSDNVGPHAGWKPHADVEESMNIINNLFLNDPCGWAIVLKENGRIIGHIGAYEDSARESVNSMEIGYALSDEYWYKGIMTEACRAVMNYCFNRYGLAIMAIRTSEVNLRSQGVIRKCGFTYEGTLRKAYHIFTGIDRDSRFYSITREEWAVLEWAEIGE